MAERIIVGLTDSDAGRRALDWAATRAAQRENSVLELITVVSGAVGAVGEGSLVDAMTIAARDFLESVAAPLRESGLRVSAEVHRGDPVRDLTKASKGAAALVIGTDFRPGQGARRGVHGLRIAAGSDCPVIVVPELGDQPRHGVVVGVDGSATSEAAIAFAAKEADRLGEPLTAVSVWTAVDFPSNPILVTSEYLDSMQGMTEEILAVSLAGLRQDYPDLEIHRSVVRGYPSQVLAEAAADAVLTVVGSHGRGAIARFLLGSISQEILIDLRGPVAVVR